MGGSGCVGGSAGLGHQVVTGEWGGWVRVTWVGRVCVGGSAGPDHQVVTGEWGNMGGSG